jgi:hypothetical protein
MDEPQQSSVEDFLARQDEQISSPGVTVESIVDDPDRVLVTIWSGDGRCGCDLALRVPKAAIQSVTATGDTAHCCGKTLTVARLTFRPDSSGWPDVLDQLAARGRRQQSASSPEFINPQTPLGSRLTMGMSQVSPLAGRPHFISAADCYWGLDGCLYCCSLVGGRDHCIPMMCTA